VFTEGIEHGVGDGSRASAAITWRFGSAIVAEVGSDILDRAGIVARNSSHQGIFLEGLTEKYVAY